MIKLLTSFVFVSFVVVFFAWVTHSNTHRSINPPLVMSQSAPLALKPPRLSGFPAKLAREPMELQF